MKNFNERERQVEALVQAAFIKAGDGVDANIQKLLVGEETGWFDEPVTYTKEQMFQGNTRLWPRLAKLIVAQYSSITAGWKVTAAADLSSITFAKPEESK